MLALLLALAAEAAPVAPDTYAQQVVERIDDIDLSWVKTHMRPRHLAAPPDERWYGRAVDALAPTGALGQLLRPTPHVAAVVDEPHGVRVILDTSPLTSLLLYPDGDTWLIDGFELTSCVDCGGPERFVRDLIAELTLPDSRAPRLLPGIELSVAEHVRAHPQLLGSHWVGALHTRDQTAGHVRAVLRHAQVTGAEDDRVHLAWPDGHTETWTVRPGRYGWELVYDALPDDSRLRFGTRDLTAWREDRLIPRTRLQNWEPPWREEHGALLIATDAVDACFDPRDGSTVLIGLSQLDGHIAGIVRVDPSAGTVDQRVEVPPSTQNPTSVSDWFARWPMAISPAGNEALLAMPTRLWRVNLTSGASQTLVRTNRVRSVTWRRTEANSERIVVAEANGALTLIQDAGWQERWVRGEPVGVEQLLEGLVITTADGQVTLLSADGVQTPLAKACTFEAVASALSPDASELLVQCGPNDPSAGARVPLEGGEVVHLPGNAGADGAVSWSPDGRLFTTDSSPSSSFAVTLWSARDNEVVATFGPNRIHGVRWSPDGDQLITLGRDGSVWLWDLTRLRQTHSRTESP